MKPPPVIATNGSVQRLAHSSVPVLAAWQQRYPLYTQYATVMLALPSGLPPLGIPFLASDDVPRQKLQSLLGTARRFLLHAPRQSARLVAALAAAGTRVLVAADADPMVAWPRHPEGTDAAGHAFATGLGGGAAWFPSTGVGVTASELLEELFHTVQYVFLSPRQTCIYYILYAAAVRRGLYRPEELEAADLPSSPAEPVPTSQADEYFAMAMLRWFDVSDGYPEEYAVPGPTPLRSSRESLHENDPGAWCLLAQIFRPDVASAGDEGEASRRSMAAQPLQQVRDVECGAKLLEIARVCPSDAVPWPE